MSSRHNKPEFATEIPLLVGSGDNVVDTVFIGEIVDSPLSVPFSPVAVVVLEIPLVAALTLLAKVLELASDMLEAMVVVLAFFADVTDVDE